MVFALGVIGGFPSVALAEAPTELVEDLADDGVYVSRVRVDVNEEALVAAVQQVRFDGLRIIAVAPIDPQPNGQAFARRIQEVVDADAALVFMADGTLETYVIDDLSTGWIRATEKARAVNDPARAVLAFADELTSERVQGRPGLVDQLIVAVVLMAVAIGLIVAVEQTLSANRRRKAPTQSNTPKVASGADSQTAGRG